MAAELTLDTAHQAVYHPLGAPGIASLASPDDLWIRAAEPDQEPGGGSRSLPDA